MTTKVNEPHRLSTQPSVHELPIRVCFMIDRLQVGGTETQLVSLIRNLDRNRIEPSLCVLDGQDPISRSLEPPSCPVLRLGLRSLVRFKSLRKMRELAAYLHRQRIDVLQVHFPDSTYLGIAAAMLARVPCIVRTERGFDFSPTFKDRTFGRVLYLFYNCLFVDAIVTNSYACSRALMEQEFFVPKWIEVLSNGVDLQRFEIATPRPSTAIRRVGLVATLRAVKNLDVFVRAAKIVCDADEDVVFQIAGEGPQRPALEALIQNLSLTGKVILLGSCQDVPSFLASLDVAVLCSQSESFPNAVLEYMAAGKAIVATAVGGIPELIEHERQGLLVSPGDVDALAQAVLRLLRDRAFAARLGASARYWAKSHGTDVATRRYEQFYLALASQSAAYRRRHRSDRANQPKRVDQALLPQNPAGNPSFSSATFCGNSSIHRIAASPFSLLTRRDLANEPDLQEAWQSLTHASASPYVLYQSPLWWDHLCANRSAPGPFLAVMRGDASQAYGVAPFEVVRHRLPLFGGAPTLSFYFDVLSLIGSEPLIPNDPRLYEQLFDDLLQAFPKCAAIYLKSVPRESVLWSFLQRESSLRQSYIMHLQNGIRRFDSLVLPPTYADYLAKFPAKKRYNLKRQQRLLRDQFAGNVVLNRVEREDQVDAFVVAMRSVSGRSWKGANGIQSHPSLTNNRELFDAARRGFLRSYTFQCGDRCLAFVLGYQAYNVYHYSDIGFDEEFGRFSPGNVLLNLIIEDLFRHRPPKKVNFGAGPAEYKQHFGNHSTHEAGVLLFRKTAINQFRTISHRLCSRVVNAAKQVRQW